MKYPLFVTLILTIITVSFGVNPEYAFNWKYIEFRWAYKGQKEEMLNSGQYNPNSCVLYDVDRSEDGRIFVTAVTEKGVPASLMTVSTEIGPGGPLLDPYPNWSWYDANNDCDGIISVYRISIKCNYLFVLDCGKIGEEAVCPPKLLIFDLGTNYLIKRITIPDDIASNENGTGLLVTPLAYVPDCNNINDATVFMSDIEGYGLAIYNENSGFCRIESDFMKPTNPNFTITGQSFYLEDGILGLAIIDKDLFYSPLAGNQIYKMNMFNKQKCSELNKSEAGNLTQLAGILSGQTAAIASEQCAIFFSNIPDTSILCQDATKKFISANTELIVNDSTRLQFASGMKVVNHGKTVMTLTNSFQRVITNTLNLNEINFRILTMDIEEIRKETSCFASCNNDHGKPGQPGQPGHPEYPGQPGYPGHPRYPEKHKYPEHPGHPGQSRYPGQPEYPGWYPGYPEHRHGRLWYYDKPWYYNKYDEHNKYDNYDKYDK